MVENARLGQDLETQKLNLADINEFLTSELDKTSAKLIQLEDKAGRMQQRLDDLMENHVVCQHSHAIDLVLIGLLYKATPMVASIDHKSC